jgi:hypothetical protein
MSSTHLVGLQIPGMQLLITDTLHFADIDSTAGLRHGE